MAPPIAPLIDLIGETPVFHGERGAELDPAHAEACLCGHDPYYLCPEWPEGSIATLEFIDG
jgi:hypothetical protein